jgi:heme exporter protein D
MENDLINKIWDTQDDNSNLGSPSDIINKAKRQRKGQYITITVLSVTVAVLVFYTFYVSLKGWNSFNLGLLLMISSLVFRIILELASVYRKEKQLLSMPQKMYYAYLKKHYNARLIINYVITPICIAAYIYGFTLLLPYFKDYFSEGFYNYILISGVVSLLVIVAIIIRSVIKEQRFLKQLKEK